MILDLNLTLLNKNISKNSAFAWFFLLKSLSYQRLFLSLQRQFPPSFSTMLKCVGLFCIYTFYSQNTLMEKLPHFTKYYMIKADLVALLKSSGLIISDEAKAVRYLESIGYYRLSAYMYPFLKVSKKTHQYKDGTTFQQVLESWITSLTLLRNACCHHSRVWNKVSSIMPVSIRLSPASSVPASTRNMIRTE